MKQWGSVCSCHCWYSGRNHNFNCQSGWPVSMAWAHASHISAQNKTKKNKMGWQSEFWFPFSIVTIIQGAENSSKRYRQAAPWYLASQCPGRRLPPDLPQWPAPQITADQTAWPVWAGSSSALNPGSCSRGLVSDYLLLIKFKLSHQFMFNMLGLPLLTVSLILKDTAFWWLLNSRA